MREPIQKDDAFLRDIAASQADPRALSLWWLGQSGFLLQHNNRHVLLDPYLSDSLTHKYAQTDKPHVRMTARVVSPERLHFVEIISASHSHTDHCDPVTITSLFLANPHIHFVFPESTRAAVLARAKLPTIYSGSLVGLDDGGCATFGDIEFHALPSAHEKLDRDDHGRSLYLGYIVTLGPWTIYHSGDTILYDGLVERLSRWKIDIALLPINGRHPGRGVAGNLTGPEAADLAKAAGGRLVIPCHYDMFEFNTATPDAFVARCQQINQPFHILKNGGKLTLR